QSSSFSIFLAGAGGRSSGEIRMSRWMSERFLLFYNLPLCGDSGKIDSRGEDAVIQDPDAPLAGDCVLPNEVRLTGTEEVCRSCDMPLNWDSGKIDHRGEDAILHDPDTVLTG